MTSGKIEETTRFYAKSSDQGELILSFSPGNLQPSNFFTNRATRNEKNKSVTVQSKNGIHFAEPGDDPPAIARPNRTLKPDDSSRIDSHHWLSGMRQAACWTRPGLGSDRRPRSSGQRTRPSASTEPLEQRQVCWAHLKRDFQKCLERGGTGKTVGDVGLMVVEDVFTLWWDYREYGLDRPVVRTKLGPLVEELREALERGSGCSDRKVMGFCDNLQTLYPALWPFAGIEGVEPMNNHAERTSRLGVLWRENAFGCHK